jgi:thioredoxin-related protein
LHTPHTSTLATAGPPAVQGWRPIHRLAAGVLLAGLLTTLAARAEPRDPREHFFTRTFGDLPEELATVREEGKAGILLFYEQPGCPYCARMLEGALADPALQDWFTKRFLVIAVNIRSDVELTDLDGITLPSHAFAEHRRVFATPVLSFIGPDGTEVYRRNGEVRTPEELLLIGEYVAAQAYVDTTFETFAARRRGGDDPEGTRP